MLILCVTIFLPTTVSTGLQGMPCQLESQVHSTNTLIDEVGLVEMEVGLGQLTWGDADLQRELRRLKDNSLKIPNLKYIFKIALLRVIPTRTHYSDIVSDISSGRICGIYVLTYYLTFFSEILFDILSGILSGIYSDILSGIYYILILPCHEFGLGVLLFAWINANGLNIHQMLVSHVCTQWLPLPLIPQNGQVLNLRVGPEKFSGYWKNRTLAQGLKDVGGRFRYAVGLQSWVNNYHPKIDLGQPVGWVKHKWEAIPYSNWTASTRWSCPLTSQVKDDYPTKSRWMSPFSGRWWHPPCRSARRTARRSQEMLQSLSGRAWKPGNRSFWWHQMDKLDIQWVNPFDATIWWVNPFNGFWYWYFLG